MSGCRGNLRHEISASGGSQPRAAVPHKDFGGSEVLVIPPHPTRSGAVANPLASPEGRGEEGSPLPVHHGPRLFVDLDALAGGVDPTQAADFEGAVLAEGA